MQAFYRIVDTVNRLNKGQCTTMQAFYRIVDTVKRLNKG